MADDLISLGLGAAEGFSGDDLTSPATAGAAGAIPDALPPARLTEQNSDSPAVTELRVHGVSGSDGPTMLEHPNAIQVAGDSVTRFYRRWTPAGPGGDAVPWRLEAYSWGGLTEAPLAAASWILLAPFMLFNVAHFMLPRTKNREELKEEGKYPALRRDGWHAVAAALLRLLAVIATAQFAMTAMAVLVNVLAYQARQAHLPSWMGALSQRSPDVRVALATVVVTLVVGALWWVSVVTANRYEARVSKPDSTMDDSPLTQPMFWHGEELVRRHRSLHTAAALAVTALVVARPTTGASPFRMGVATAAGALLAAVLVSLCLPLADRHRVVLLHPEPVHRGATNRGRGTGGAPAPVTGPRNATPWCQGVLGAAIVVVAASLFTGGWKDPHSPAPRTFGGFTMAWLVVLAAQAALLLALLVVVWRCARLARPADPDPDRDPFLGGHLTTVLATLGATAGGLLSCLAVLFLTRLVGNPIPSGSLVARAPRHGLEVPWPLYAFAAAPGGLMVAVLVAAIWLVKRWRTDVDSFSSGRNGQPWVDAYYGISAGPGGSGNATTPAIEGSPESVAAYFGLPARSGGDPGTGRPGIERARLRIARAWATARLTDAVPAVVLLITGAALIAILVAGFLAWQSSHRLTPLVPGIASAEGVVGLFLAGLLVTLLRTAYQDPSRRKTIGALWDVATFWPRATHPFAPPCYAERAIPELVDRIRVLTGHVAPAGDDPAWLSILAHRPGLAEAATATTPSGKVLLTGYSQGSVIAPAVIAQLPAEVVRDVALLTLACPARRLYGRAFPAYFGRSELYVLARRLASPPVGPSEEPDSSGQRPEPIGTLRWRNLVRETDYIGSWLVHGVAPDTASATPESSLDQPCPDPPALVPDGYPTPPPIHRHSDFWPDPCTKRLGKYLVDQLSLAKDGSSQQQRVEGLPAARGPVLGENAPTGTPAAHGEAIAASTPHDYSSVSVHSSLGDVASAGGVSLSRPNRWLPGRLGWMVNPMLPTPQEVTPEDDQPLSAPYIVGLALLACIAVAATVILIIARGHEEDYVWPATTTAVAGLAGSLVAILLSPQTMVPRTQTGRRISIFTWALCALVGTATAIGVFVLASAAFPPARGPASFNYAGLALLGAVLGYLAATAVLLQRLGGSATYLGQLTSILERQAEQLFPSIAPVVERTFIDLIAGPPSPPYQGYVALDIRKGEASLGHAWGMDRDSADRTSSHIFVWFDTTSPKADARAPIRVPGNRWPNETDAEANDTSPSVEFEVLFHNASDPGSPQVNKIRTPVSGRSADIKFDTFDLRELPAVSDAYLEIRHASKMVQIVNLPKRGSADAKP